MHDEQAVLRSVKAALAGELDEGADLAVSQKAPLRRRSSLFFVGTAGEGPPVSRWVVKQPHVDTQQHDLASPVSARGQLAALRRLHGHLETVGGGLHAPRPVAYVPDLSAYVMEYVPGPTLTDLLTSRTVLRPGRLLEGIASAARLLQAVHAMEPGAVELVDVEAVFTDARTRGRGLLADARLRSRERWFLRSGITHDPATVSSPTVLLHGDFAPENVVLSPSGVCCLEPDLTERGWPEHDVARFLLMLFDAPLFVTGVDVPPVQVLRRRAARTFLAAYYGPEPRSPLLRPVMLLNLCARWTTRHNEVVHRSPRFELARKLLLRRHFSRLLDEVSAARWL